MRITGGGRRRPTIRKAPKWEERRRPKAKYTELEKKLAPGKRVKTPPWVAERRKPTLEEWRKFYKRDIEFAKLMRIPQKIKRMK